MKIKHISAVGLRDATPEGGWSEEIDKDLYQPAGVPPHHNIIGNVYLDLRLVLELVSHHTVPSMTNTFSGELYPDGGCFAVHRTSPLSAEIAVNVSDRVSPPPDLVSPECSPPANRTTPS